ncbi:glycosyltransferase family 4 protein [Geitlerinema sp. PCC 9228]|uniref:glycosyltransferase family 4 protein n=1 Tax=Geitlerinema sp. PCC 9228 TaxID=111611 RepID=UPI0008F9934E|nr:glycosyltransferase family 4 protein [Geitlerinema sp. PCC 9228]
MKPASIAIAGAKHISIPNLPRHSQNIFFKSLYWPLDRIWSPFQNLATWRFPISQECDLLHAFNAIPVTNKPFLVTISVPPFVYKSKRTRGAEALFFRFLRSQLTAGNCKKIIFQSDYAKQRYLNAIQNEKHRKIVLEKETIVHPNFIQRTSEPKALQNKDRVNLIFVGGHFARKGGVVAVRVAKKALEKNLPISVRIISDLKLGAGVPTDFPNKEQYRPDLELLDLPNVEFYGRLPNDRVLEMMANSDFQIMPSLHDEYGYSIAEGFSTATPAIATNICALPELVRDNQNGYIISLGKKENRLWSGWGNWKRLGSDRHWELVDRAYNYLAEEIFTRLQLFLERSDRQEHYEMLSQGALHRFQIAHESRKMSEILDRMYGEALEN